MIPVRDRRSVRSQLARPSLPGWSPQHVAPGAHRATRPLVVRIWQPRDPALSGRRHRRRPVDRRVNARPRRTGRRPVRRPSAESASRRSSSRGRRQCIRSQWPPLTPAGRPVAASRSTAPVIDRLPSRHDGSLRCRQPWLRVRDLSSGDPSAMAVDRRARWSSPVRSAGRRFIVIQSPTVRVCVRASYNRSRDRIDVRATGACGGRPCGHRRLPDAGLHLTVPLDGRLRLPRPP